MALGLTVMLLSGVVGPRLWIEQRNFFSGVLLGGGIVFLTGLWDDLRGLPPIAKLIAQGAAAAVAFGLGLRVEVLSLGPTMDLPLGWVSLPLTILWVVGVTNAFNLIDGLDGLATGIALVALSTTLVVALLLGNLEVVVVCLALIGALLGFLPYNFNPARIFLGDSGSLFVGFMLAILSVHGSLKSATAVLVIVPLFALALPLLDTLLAIARRWLRGVPLSGADARHIHHQLLAVGFTHRRAVVVLYVAAIALATLGVSLAFAPPAAVLGIAIVGGGLSGALFLFGTRHLAYHEFTEAGAVLGSGVLRVRRVIRDQIHAQDVAQLIRQAQTLDDMTAVLDANVSRFGFLGMEVCREMSRGRHIALLNGDTAQAWKLDFPVTPRRAADDDPYVLRIWCGAGDSCRPYGAERVVRILAPTIESWFAHFGYTCQASVGMAAAAGAPSGDMGEADSRLDAVLGWARGASGPPASLVPRPVGTSIAWHRAALRRHD
jgi:UDP-GlcNAc:undecaprenyl-phosphate GlcNAc-1-phosphate transferase